jgi:hypothetical protein
MTTSTAPAAAIPPSSTKGTPITYEGHWHHPHAGHVDEHTIGVSGRNPESCTPAHACGGHGQPHTHAPGCGHDAVPHGDHTDYVVGGHLHHPHGSHCDDHGPV